MKMYRIIILAALLSIVLTLIYIPSDESKRYEQDVKELDRLILNAKQNDSLCKRINIEIDVILNQLDTMNNILKQQKL